MSLTDVQIRNAKAGPKARKLADGRGLFLVVLPTGSKSWRYFYRFAGKQKTLAIGTFPDVSLKEARERLQQARTLLANGDDPAFVKQREKAARKTAAINSFEGVAREWFEKFSPGWSPSHAHRTIRRLERDVFPWLGKRPIGEIEPPELLAALRRIESRGTLDTAHRAHQNCTSIFRYAVATGRVQRDPSADIRGAIPPIKQAHLPSITDPVEIGALLRAIDGYTGSYVVRAALQLAPRVFVRPGELRQAEWGEVDFENSEWRIPAAKMKMNATHIVPLSTQAVAILRELHPLTGHGRYVFPSGRGRGRPMSENTVNAALRKLGYAKDQMTGHGFRSMASTLLNEQGYPRDVIERQLAHSERDKVRAAYNYAEWLPERRRMMQDWSDYLDLLRDERKVIHNPRRTDSGKAARRVSGPATPDHKTVEGRYGQ